MNSILGVKCPTPVFGTGLSLSTASADSVALSASYYSYPLICFQASSTTDMVVNLSSDGDVDTEDFLIPAGSTIYIGRPLNASGVTVYGRSLDGQTTGQLQIHAAYLRELWSERVPQEV